MFHPVKTSQEWGVGYFPADSTSGSPRWDLCTDPPILHSWWLVKASVKPVPLNPGLALHLDLASLNPKENRRGQEGLTRHDFELHNTPERAIKCR